MPDLLSLAEARSALGIGAADQQRDLEIQFYIDAVTPVIEDIVGPIDARTVTERHDGGGSVICLRVTPVLSITSVDALGDTIASDEYEVDLETGVIECRNDFASTFPGGWRDVEVVYSAGRVTVPDNIKLAARRLLRHLWQQEQQGFRPQMGAPEAVTPSGFAVPRVVMQLCGTDARVSGFA